MSQQLRIVTFGQIEPGFKREAVAANLARLCKYRPETIVRLFSGARFVFKSGLDRQAADRYLQALGKAGIVCSIETVEPVQPTPESLSFTPDFVSSVTAVAPIRIVCPMCGTEQNESERCVECGVLLAKSSPTQAPPEPQVYAISSEYEQSRKRGNPGLILLIVALVVGSIGALAVFAAIELFGQFNEKFMPEIAELKSSMSGEFEQVPPPVVPAVSMDKPHISIAERQQLRELRKSQQFTALNERLTTIQSEFEADPVYEIRVMEAFNLFTDTDPALQSVFDAWVAATPEHFAPYLARGKYYAAIGWKKRGNKYARNTSTEQFAGMRSYFDRALDDLDAALQRNPDLLPAYQAMIGIKKAHGSKRALNAVIDRAQQRFPATYQIYKTILKAKLPRWGGSYREMTRYAHLANEHVGRNTQMPFLYGKPYMDLAWYANRKKKYPEAIRHYNQALSYGEYANLLELRGKVYERMGEQDKALADYDRALELSPRDTTVLRKRATFYFNKGDYTAALADIQTAEAAVSPRNKYILRWYRWAIKQLLSKEAPAANNYILHANLYDKAKKAQQFPDGKPLGSLEVKSRFFAPEGTFPYGLTWFNDALYMSSYRQQNPGLYRLDPADGRVLSHAAPDIVYKDQYGGLTADANSLYHTQGYYSYHFDRIDPESLKANDKLYIYASQFQLGDLARHDGHFFAIGYHQASAMYDYRLLKFSDDGILRDVFIIKPVKDRSASPGIASDGRHLWVSMGSVFYRIDPATGDIVDGFEVPDACYGLAWDGQKLWGVGDSGEFFTYELKR